MNTLTPRRLAGAVLGTLLLSGCATGPDFVQPDSGLGDAVLAPRPGYAAGVPATDAAVPAQWWVLFNDPVLTELQVRAQEGNLDMKMAMERIEQGRAQLGIASAQLLPTAGAGAGVAREALSEHGKFAALGAPSSPSDFWQVAFDAGWEIDLWGRARRAREGAAAALEATVYEHEAARVALAAEVGRTYLQLRGAQAQLAIARENLAVAERVLGLTESRRRNGVATEFEMASARAQLAATRGIVPKLAERRNGLLNALALLLGDKPRALDTTLGEARSLPPLPAGVPLGLPSALARRRPDILRAEAQLHAATAAIGVAKADFYPRLALKGRFGLEAFDSGDLASWDARFFSVGPTVYLPIFEGGRLTRRLALSESGQKTAALAYRKTVLQAWHEVDNALDAWAAGQEQHAALAEADEQNRRALHAAERGYRDGAGDYLAVLTAQRNVLASQSALDDSTTGLTLALFNLYKSLGGGWDPQAGDAR
jgi:NodT family efflux transporter outer membrane factor (OMF) lipoprotein